MGEITSGARVKCCVRWYEQGENVVLDGMNKSKMLC